MNLIEAREAIRGAIEAGFEREQADIELYSELVRIWRKFEGKRPTRRMRTAVEKEHPDWSIHWRDEYGMWSVTVYGGDTGRERYDDGLTLYIASRDHYKWPPLYTVERLEDGSHGKAARKRQAQRKAMLEDGERLDELADSFVAMTEAKERFEKALGNHLDDPSCYDIERALGLRGE